MTAECNHLIFLSEIKSALRYNVPLDVIRSRREAHCRRRLVMKAVGGEGDTSHPPWLQILEDASRRLRVVLIWWGDSWEEIACTIDFYLLGCWNVAQPRQGSWFPAFKLWILRQPNVRSALGLFCVTHTRRLSEGGQTGLEGTQSSPACWFPSRLCVLGSAVTPNLNLSPVYQHERAPFHLHRHFKPSGREAAGFCLINTPSDWIFEKANN